MSSWVVPGFAQERELGAGASGRVVAAVHVASGTRVAIKYLSPGLLTTPGFLAAFRSEAALLRTLDTPQVVRLFDYVEEPGQGAAIVMELVDGVSLYEMITRQGPTGPQSALAVLKGSLLGLAAAHALGIVHRDYKPENVLVDGAGHSKLTDFGVATRAGQAASGGTPLYMAPEQWAGAPASPATDTYAATAVFFECLTGKPPFSGPLGQLAAQHQDAAVPVELVDQPLRELVTRGMAKDPAARPPNAAEFVAELEVTAAAAYGAGWESAGRRHLTAQAAALALLLYGATGGAGAGSGASSTVTWLSTVKSAVASHAFIYTGIAAAVIGIVGGSLAGISRATQHPPVSAVSATASPARPSATPSPTAALVSAACGSSGAALAYLVGSGGVDSAESVVVRCGTSAPRELGSFQFFNDPSRPSLAWSADGTQLAWVTSTALYVGQASHGAWSLRHWACQACGGIAFRGNQAVTVSGQAAGGPATAAIPQLLVFPPSGPSQPVTVPVTGITTVTGETNFLVLGNLSPADLVVEYGVFGGNSGGGGQLLFRVNSAGRATQYGHATINPAASTSGVTPPAGAIYGRVLDVAVSPDDSRFAFSDGTTVTASCGIQRTLVLDTATGSLQVAKVLGGSPEAYWVQGLWFDKAGTPYASLVRNLSACATGATAAAPAPWPANAAPIVCKLVGTTWVKTSTGVFRAAYGPGNWLAEQVGVTNALNALAPQPLVISAGASTTSVTVPNVTAFAWAPA